MIVSPGKVLGHSLLCLVALLFLFQLSRYIALSPTILWLEKLKFHNDQRFQTFYDQQPPRTPLSPGSPIWQSNRDTLEIYSELISDYSSSNALLQRLNEKCIRKNEFDKIIDPECRAWWLAVLHKEEIVDIGITLGFLRSEHKLGALQVYFANGMKGWYKPCGLSNEYPEREVEAGGIESIIGFSRAPPSVMRNTTIDFFRSIVEKQSNFFPLDKKFYILDQTFMTCSHEGNLRGSMTGWWNGIEDGKSLPKTKKYMKQFFPLSSIEEERSKLSDAENAEEIHSHILLFLLNILRVPGKNEFISYGGTSNRKYFLGVDLDRTDLLTRSSHKMTFCDACIVGEETLANVSQAYYHFEEFSRELQSAWFTLGGFYLDELELNELYLRLRYVINCFDSCPVNHVIPSHVWNIRNDFQ